MPIWVALLAFVCVFGAFAGTYWLLVVLPEQHAEHTLERRLEPVKRLRVVVGAALQRSVTPLSTLRSLEKVLAHVWFARNIEVLVQRSGLSLTVGRLVLGMAFAALLAFAVALWLTSSALIAGVAAVVVGPLPWAAVSHVAKRRVMKFEEQFPEAIELIARAMRAGHAFTTGLSMVAEEVPAPLGTEFRLLYDRQNFGMPLGDAMKSLAEGVPILDARFFVTAVLTQREAGGNLAEVLDSLAALIRDRFRLRRQVQALSAHGRTSGLVLTYLPFAMAGLLFLIAPEHIMKLFTDPLGVQMVTVVAVLQVIGFIAMRRIVDIEI